MVGRACHKSLHCCVFHSDSSRALGRDLSPSHPQSTAPVTCDSDNAMQPFLLSHVDDASPVKIMVGAGTHVNTNS